MRVRRNIYIEANIFILYGQLFTSTDGFESEGSPNELKDSACVHFVNEAKQNVALMTQRQLRPYRVVNEAFGIGVGAGGLGGL